MRFFGCAGESGGGITVSRRYDSLGRVIEEKETDGTDTSVNNYSYDVSGNRTEHKLTLSGEVRSWKSYTYDLLGRMKTVGERPILTEKYDYSYKIMIFTMGGYEEYARYSLSYVGDCGEYCSEFDTMEAFYWHDHENSAWYEISLDPEEPLCGEMYISSSGKMAGSIGYQDGSMICRAEEISDLSEIDPDAGTIYYVIDGTNNIRYTVFAQNNCYYLYPGSDGGFSIPTYIAGGEAEIVAEYTYDARGNILTETKENGITTYYTYNAAGLPKTVTTKRGETVISGYTYAYMLDGNIKSITETSGKTVNYTYDGLGRLVKEEKLDNGTTGVISYIYDVNGNRTGKNENGVVTTYTYDANNRLISENCGGWLTTYSYDANGNRTGIFVNNNFAGTYSYDLFGKQTSYTANNIGYTYYTYRPDGLRHSVGSTKHIWDGSNIVAEKYGNSETYYTYGIGLIKSGEEYYVFNWHGDVIALTSLTGAITKTYEYDAFGVEDDIDENDPNPWRYCGEYYDKETKTLYLRARYYAPSIGRFLAEDRHWNVSNMIYGDIPVKWNESPSGENELPGINTCVYMPDFSAINQSGNLYAYVTNNPVRYIDPTGELAWPGEIHSAVSKYVAVKYGFLREQIIDYKFGWGRADLISTNGQVWEIKPDNERHIEIGKKQVQKYAENKWHKDREKHLEVGGWIPDGEFIYSTTFVTYRVTYRYAGGGVIAYKYEEEVDQKKVEEAQAMIAFFGIAAAVIFLSAATGGAGLALLPAATMVGGV